jgi:hypothetical protein
MNIWTYDFEVQTMITMFMNAMSDIVIKRFNVHKQARDQIKTRIVYAPKQRVLNDLLDRDQNLQLPVIACYIGGIARDSTRVFNKILGTFNDAGYGAATNEKAPLPVDLTINVSIMTRYQADMDQILTHLLPYINPYFTVSWRTPGRQEHEIRSNIVWNGSVNIAYPIDQNATQSAKVTADLSFVFKGWLFQAIANETIGTILNIHTTYNADIKGVPAEYLIGEEIRESTTSSDYLFLQGNPPKPTFLQPSIGFVNKRQQFNVYGSGFSKITNIYLSGAPVSLSSVEHQPFSNSIRLSSTFPPFTGLKLLSTEWMYNKDNVISFIMPSINKEGRVDLIIESPAGYGLLTENVRINTFNPFFEGTTDHASFTPYQMPYLSGIPLVDLQKYQNISFASYTNSITSALSTDSDNDGFSNAIEISEGTNINDPLNLPNSLFSIFPLL